MIIKEIRINNFRSYYGSNCLSLSQGLTLIIGDNGDGKTTLFEALEWLFDTTGENNYLYRIFFYDCAPFLNKIHNPISNKCVDFSKTEIAKTQLGIFEELKRKRKVALRLGNIKSSNKWMIYPKKIKELLNHQVTIDDLTENDVYLGLSQKGIDMKIGVDIASLALKHFVDKIVLISGDSDFVPAAKLARREGIDFVLDPMHAKYIENSLYEHIDGLKSVPLPYPKDKRREDTHNKRKARIQKPTKDDNNC